MVLKTISIAAAALGAVLSVPAAEVVLDGCRSAENWNSFNGSEFKGAKVMVSGTPKGLKLDYDFSEGGLYVGVHNKKLSIPAADSISVTVNASEPAEFNYRVIDATGRVFQGKGFSLKKGVDQTLNLSVKGPWQTVWGGEGDHKAPVMPIKSVWLMVTKGKDLPAAGSVTLKSFKAQVPKLPESAATGENFQRNLAGWTVRGEWLPQLEGAMLKLTPKANGAGPALLEVSFPQPGRDLVQRYRLDPKAADEIYYKLPLASGVNPRNAYNITLRIDGGNGEKAQFTTTVKGKLAGSVNLGEPKSSKEIEASKFGTCVHFSYAPKPEGAFKGWYPKELLLDMISDCGFKYIREGLALDKLPDGSWKIRDIDLNTLKMAKERGIEQIVEIGMSPSEPLPEFLKKVQSVVEGSRDYVNIYELGNEPHNFGGWRQTFKYKGKDANWNGWEADGTVSEWLKVHTRYTNAAADLIKKIAPEKTVIGLGSCSPTNFHALNLGVTKSLDGVVDHPYTYSLPPEKVPFGKSLTKRDGIAVGDDSHTFRGLVESYIEHFNKTGKARSLWITEFGFTTFNFTGEKVKGMYAGFSEDAQALYLLRRFIEGLALPVAVACQYDFLDDYGSDPKLDEANFGLVRADYTPKPSYYVMQRMNSLLAGTEPDAALKAKVTNEALHRSAVRGELVKDWDQSKIDAANGIRVYGFRNPKNPDERMVAVWSMQPYSGEFTNRTVGFEVEGLAGFEALPVVIDMITGNSFDFPVTFKDGKAVVTELPLKQNVLLFKFFRQGSNSPTK